MAVLEDSIELIRDSYHEEVDLAHLPQDDRQFMPHCKRPTQLACFKWRVGADVVSAAAAAAKVLDIVVQVAIIRPGPIVGTWFILT